MSTKTWYQGDIIVFRGLGRQKIWYALPVIVVVDRPDLIAFFWRAGTQGKWRMRSPGSKVPPAEVEAIPMQLINHTWTSTDVLMLITPGAAHAVYVMWEAGQKKQNCWYINLQEPILRTPIGFDTQDHWLDVVISPDKTTWRWKDEDQLAEAVDLAIVQEQKAQAIRAEGIRVIERLLENQTPFCDGWENWFAPTDWEIPALPEYWDSLFQSTNSFLQIEEKI